MLLDQTVRVDAALQIGQASETVTVTGTAELLKTDNAEISMNVNGDKVNDLPINFGGGGIGYRRHPELAELYLSRPGRGRDMGQLRGERPAGQQFQSLPGRSGFHQQQRRRLDQHTISGIRGSHHRVCRASPRIFRRNSGR